jgi:hypothetical protein
MTEVFAPSASANGTPVQPQPDRRRQELARMLQTKLAQGFEIESESETKAVLVMKGRRKWFGLSNGARVRYEVTVDERGRAKSRRL